MYILSRSDCFLYSRRVMVPRVSGKRLLLIESDLSMGPGFARQGSNLLSAPEKHHLFTSLLLVTRYLYSYHAQCLPCLSARVSISLSVCLDTRVDFLLFTNTSHALNSRGQFQSNSIYLFIHSSLQISLVENGNPETQENKTKKNQKRAKCPRRRKRNRKLSNVW